MKYHEAMRKDPKGWKKAVQKEHERMVEHGVFKPIDMNQVPKKSKILTILALQGTQVYLSTGWF